MKLVVIRLPDDIYRELEERAKREGYSLVSDYVKSLVLRELGRSGVDLRSIEERLERLESGELPQPLIERIGSIVRAVLQEELKGVQGLEDIDRIVARLERRVQDMINPWTGKVDRALQAIAELQERLEALEEEVKKLREAFEEQRERLEHVEQREHRVEVVPRRHGYQHYPHGGEEGYRRRRRTAIEWLREKGVLFESELTRLRDRDAFFEKLRREGALVIELPGERVAVDRDYWTRFLERLRRVNAVREDEVRAVMDDAMFKLFQKLKEAGLVYFDARTGTWRVSRELGGEEEEAR